MAASFGQCNIRCARADFVVDVNFTVPEKGVLGIFGHSGSGKTTLLRCLAGLEKKVEGTIKIAGVTWLSADKKLSPQQRNIAYVFQDGRLFPHLTVSDNLHYGARRSPGITGGEATKLMRIDRDNLVGMLNIGKLLDRYPHQLSGGEKQRVAIGRALLSNPQLLLLDEPLASLDKKHKQEILPYLEVLHEELNIPMIYVSHDLDEMLRFCDFLLVMEHGKLRFSGDIHDALIHQESPLAIIDNAVALLEGTVLTHEKSFELSIVQTVNGNYFQVPGLLATGKHVRLVVFASDVSVTKNKADDTSILNIIEGKVSAVLEKKDGRVLLQINCKQDILLSLISAKSFQLLQLAIGVDIYIQVKAVVTRRA
ncbi:MAG: molybdenum ABC transporter ATP-binding protein [Gammaproteobacteria bacterium]|nr:molybdenum ABC transporter ATP-binding protein [Gammaproteobacteria bacterium]